MKGFSKINNSLFSSSLSKAGISKQIKASQYVLFAEDILNERFGEGSGLHAKPMSVKQRVLTIEIAHPAIGEEITKQVEALISAINKKIGHPEIVRIQFAVKKGDGHDNPSE